MTYKIYTFYSNQYIFRSTLTMYDRLEWDEWRKGKNVITEQIGETELIRIGDWERFQKTVKEAG